MNPPCKDIAEFLGDESSLDLTLGTDLFFGRMPDQPNICVCVFDNPGDPPMLTLDKPTSRYFYSSVSVRVRENSYEAGWTKLNDIIAYLHGLNQQNCVDESSYYGLIKALNDPQVLYWDKNDRVVFFSNFEIQRKPNEE
jgi:hypothetical protein